MGKGKKFVSGYWYRLGMHLGISHGPIDELSEIRVGGRTAWAGSVTTATQIVISALNLFGGKKREGGVQGTLDVMMGAADQGVNDYLAIAQAAGMGDTALQPAYRGIFSLVWRGGIVSANNPYVKPWSFRCKRITAGWDGAVWYSAKAAVDVSEVGTGVLFGANPAHILYECLTNSVWGLGYPAGTLDLDSFTEAADTFYAEGFGLCMQWQRQESIQNFIQLVCDHAGAAIGQDVRTGLWRLRAIRDDYDIEDLPVFSEENGTIISLDGFERASPTETINELTVGFSDILLAKQGSVTVHHLANITSQGYVVAQKQDYPGIPTMKLAARVAERDIRTLGSSIARVRFVATRAAYGLLPGDVIRFSWPKLGVASMVLRIGKVNYGSLTDGKIEIEAVEDTFGLPAASYINPPPIGWQPPNTNPVPAEHYSAFEIPYREIAATAGAANAQVLPTTSGFIAGVARKPPVLSFAFELRTKIGAAAYEEASEGPWTPTATLAANLTRTATTVQLANVIDLDQVDTGTACLIGSEICRVDAVDTGTNTITVGRGCADTVPQAWATGARVWFYDSWAAADQTEYVLGDVVDAKFITITGTGELAEGSAPTASVTINRRAARPYPPGRVRLNSESYPERIIDVLTVSWAHRDRLGQQDDLIDTNALDIGPEVGQGYQLRLYDQNGILRRTETLGGTSYTWTDEISDSGGGYGEATGITWSQSSVFSGLAATATNMRDGLTTTGAGTNSGGTQWIRADLGSAKNISKVTLRGGNITGWGVVAPYLNGAVIQYSIDGSTGWTTVATVSGISDAGSAPPVDFVFTPVSARYWRISISGYLATSEFQLFESSASMLNSQVRIRLESQRSSLSSWQEIDITVPRVFPIGTESGTDRLVTEAGDIIILE